MKKYLLGLATGVAATVLTVKYKKEIYSFYESVLCDCKKLEQCEFCFLRKRKAN